MERKVPSSTEAAAGGVCFSSRASWSTPAVYLEEELRKSMVDTAPSRPLPAIDDFACLENGAAKVHLQSTLISYGAGKRMEHLSSQFSFDKKEHLIRSMEWSSSEVEHIVSTFCSNVGKSKKLAATLPLLEGYMDSSDLHHLNGVLRAITTDKNAVHMRPIFSANDLRAALRDLSDPKIFSRGYIQLPLHSQGKSHKVNRNKVYRYVFQLNKEPIVVEFVKPEHAISKREGGDAVGSAVRERRSETQYEIERRWQALRPFICPYLHSHLYQKRVLSVDAKEIPQELRNAASEVVKALATQQAEYRSGDNSTGNLLLEATMDFECCVLVPDDDLKDFRSVMGYDISRTFPSLPPSGVK